MIPIGASQLSLKTEHPLARVNEEYLVICKMFELIESGDRDAFFYQLRKYYSGMRYHLNLFHLACVRAFERFQSDDAIQHMCLGAFDEYGPRPELIAFREWFESQQSNKNEKFRGIVSTLLELCDLSQAESNRIKMESLQESRDQD